MLYGDTMNCCRLIFVIDRMRLSAVDRGIMLILCSYYELIFEKCPCHSLHNIITLVNVCGVKKNFSLLLILTKVYMIPVKLTVVKGGG